MGIVANKKKPIESYVCFILLALITVVMAMEIIARYIFNDSFRFASELSRYLFIWFVFISASYAIVKNTHIRIEGFIKLWPKKLHPYLKLLGNILWFLFSLFIAYIGFRYSINMLQNTANVSSAMKIPMGFIYLSIPIGYALMVIRLIQSEFKQFKKVSDNVEGG